MKDSAELIKAIGFLLWPLITIIVILIFRRGIADLIRRLKSAEFAGLKLQLRDTVNKLGMNTIAAANQSPKRPAVRQKGQTIERQGAREIEVYNEIIGSTKRSRNLVADFRSQRITESDESAEVLTTGGYSRNLLLMSIAYQIEKELREIVFSQGEVDQPYEFAAISRAIPLLQQRGLGSEVISAVLSFEKARNQILHYEGNLPLEDVETAIDSGRKILQILENFPRQTNIVYDPRVKIYSDKECKQPISIGHGVLLETNVIGHDEKHYRIYPSTRSHFRTGQKVAWEWSSDHSWDEAWYRDPDTGEIKYGWSESMEFVGRSIDDS